MLEKGFQSRTADGLWKKGLCTGGTKAFYLGSTDRDPNLL